MDIRIKLNEICERIESNFKCPCYYEPNVLSNDVIFKLETDNKVYFQSVSTNRIEALCVPSIAYLIISEFEEQMKVKSFTVRIFPYVKKAEKNMSFEFEDVRGINTEEYPKIEFVKASEPIQVNMVVPEGWYLVIDKS